MKSIAIAAMLFGVATSGVLAQQATPPATGCLSQFEELVGKSAASLIAAGYKIAAAVPGGLWLQKDGDTTYCNVSRSREGEVICSKLRTPVKTQACQ